MSRNCLAAALALALPCLAPAATMTVVHSARNDVSAPLMSMSAVAPASTASGDQDAHYAQATGALVSSSNADPVAQVPAGALSGVTVGLGFEGQSAADQRAILGFSYVPPDTNGAVGATQYVQTTNVTLAVYDKSSGAIQLGPVLLTSMWSGFGGLCEQVEGGDPVVLYDNISGRWIITQMAYPDDFSQNYQCIAVSQTSDATGRYNRYAFPFGKDFNDYPKFGVWPDGYYFSANMFGKSFNGALACAFDRSAMLRGQAASAVCFQNDPSVSSLLPATVYGSASPAKGAPGVFVGIADGSDLNFFKLHADFRTPSNSTFTGTQIAVAPFKEICARATAPACVPQPAPGERLDGLADRLMFPLVYRNFGDHESLVVNHTVSGGPLAAVRWYEIRNPSGTPAVYQQGTVFDPNNNYWMGSVAIDKAGDIALGFSASSLNLFPSIMVVGQQAGAAPGTMQGPVTLQAGSGVQLPNSYNRWGDYSSMSVDPSDDCTFWYTQEYYKTSGVVKWATHISSFKFNNCQ